MEPSEALRLLRLSQDSSRLTPDERQGLREFLGEVFSKPGRQWSADERELAMLWLRESVNRRKTVFVVRSKLRARFRLHAEVRVEVAQEGFDEAIIMFFHRLYLKYDPSLYPSYDKEALLTSYFRTAVLNATMPLAAKAPGLEPEGGQIDAVEGPSVPAPGAGLDERRYLEAMIGLIKRTLEIAQAAQALNLRQAGVKAAEVALRCGLPKSVVADLRHAQVLQCLLEDAQGRSCWRGDEGVEDVQTVIAMTLGLPRPQVKVAVLRARQWLCGKLGQPFPDPERSDGQA